jgi:hypothetical protein
MLHLFAITAEELRRRDPQKGGDPISQLKIAAVAIYVACHGGLRQVPFLGQGHRVFSPHLQEPLNVIDLLLGQIFHCMNLILYAKLTFTKNRREGPSPPRLLPSRWRQPLDNLFPGMTPGLGYFYAALEY